MPIIRLVSIYLLVGAVVTAIFYRQEIGAMIGGGWTAIIESKGLVASSEAVSPTVSADRSSLEKAASLAAVHGAIDQDSSIDPRIRWGAARQAFQRGDVNQAEALYRSLISDYPDEIGLLSELGDLYYYLGRRQEAADTYLQAGEKLIEANRLEQALQVVSILYPLAPDKARALKERLDKLNDSGLQ